MGRRIIDRPIMLERPTDGKKKRSWCLYNRVQAIAFLLCMRLWKR